MKKMKLARLTAFVSALCLSMCTIAPQAMETEGIIVDEDTDEMVFEDEDDAFDVDFVEDDAFQENFEEETKDEEMSETDMDEEEFDLEEGEEIEILEEAEMIIYDTFEAQKFTSWFTNDARVASAVSRLDAFEAEYGRDNDLFRKGSTLFFSDMGAAGALNYINSSAAAPYTTIGSADDATSFRNMLLSMNYIYECNKLRRSIGLNELMVSDTMMGAAQASSNIATGIFAHPHLFRGGGEILAWGYTDPFSGWYTDEKELVDQGCREYNRIAHYVILIETDFQTTGFAINTSFHNDAGDFFTSCEEFAYVATGGYSVDAYLDRMINWMDNYINSYKANINKDKKIEEFVTRLYSVCLNRKPDAAGLADWTNKLKNGKVTGTQIAYNFIFSNEAVKKNLCNSCYINQLYNCFMGRNADSNGKNYWLDKISKGATRGEVFTGFATSNEFKKICSDYGITAGTGNWNSATMMVTGNCGSCGEKNNTVNDFIDRLYRVCLGRSSDANGMQYWLNEIKNGKTGEQVALSFLSSNEFVKKNLSNGDYVECLYQAFLGRAADASGKASWVNKLENGTTRETVAKGFASSNEFKKLSAQYGIKAQ